MTYHLPVACGYIHARSVDNGSLRKLFVLVLLLSEPSLMEAVLRRQVWLFTYFQEQSIRLG